MQVLLIGSYRHCSDLGPVSRRSRKFFAPGKPLQNLETLITELFYSHNMNRRSLHTRSFRHIHLSDFRYRLIENGFVSRAFEKQAPSPGCLKVDNAFCWVNHYPADSVVCFVETSLLDSDLSGGQRYPALEQLGPGH